MSALLAIARRDLAAAFTTPLAWLVLAVWLLVTNLTFLISVPAPGEASGLPLYVNSLWTGAIALILLAPALTMNAFALERTQGTLQLLLTVPVTDRALVVGKFLASWTLLLALLAATVPQLIAVHLISDLGGAHCLAGYLGMVLLAGFLAALGVWISLLAEGPVVAYVLTFGLVAMLYLMGLPGLDPQADGPLAAWARVMGLGPRLSGFLEGRFVSADAGWFLALTLGCLILAHGALRARRLHG